MSVIMVLLFMISLSYGGSTAPLNATNGLEKSYPAPNQQVPSQETTNGTYVWWEQSSDQHNETWDSDNSHWLFGPTPSYVIAHENGTQFKDNHYAEINEKLTITTIIPNDLIPKGLYLEEVRFNGWFLSPDDFYASFDVSWRPNDGYQEWSAYAYQYEMGGEGPVYPEDPFVNIYSAECFNNSDDFNNYVNFVISFTSDAPLGLFEVNLNVMDNEWNYYDSRNYATDWTPNYLSVGMRPDDAFKYTWDSSYTLQKLDLEGDELYSVSRNKDFLMRFNITGSTPEYVKLGFRIPSWMDTEVIITGWHMEPVTAYGGWIFDETLKTYVWDEMVEVTYMKDVFGPYKTRQGTDTGSMAEVEHRWLNWTGSVYEVVTDTMWIEKEFMFIWNSTTDSFNTFYGYSFYTYPFETWIPDTWDEEVTVFEPITDAQIFYELNLPLCNVRTIGGNLVVDFAGHFTDLMPKTETYSYLQFNDEVRGPDNWWYNPDTYGDNARQTEAQYQLAKQIAIDTPVTIARILREDGSEHDDWIFSVDKGENFMVRGRLQGGASIANDIDAVQFTLDASDGYWTETESRWSTVYYQVVYNLDGSYELDAFNRTEKWNITYGTYNEYVYTSYTYFDTEAGEMRERWDWVFTEVEGFHEQWYYYNQRTQEWQENSPEYRSADTRIPASFATIGSLNNWTDDGDLYVSFLVSLDESVPDTEYWWNFAFMNNTWYQDYTSGYGDHEILSWGREWVYSFDYQTEKVYVDSIDHSKLSFYNSVLNTNEGSDYLKGEERPYIVIDGDRYPLKVRERYDPYSSNVWKEFFFYDHWDSVTDRDVYFYELENGTKIYVTYSEAAYIYNVTAAGESFLTAQEFAYYWYDGVTSFYYWIDLEGAIHQGDWYTHGEPYVTKVFYDITEINHQDYSYYVRYGTNGILPLLDFWYWDYNSHRYYMTDINLNSYPITESGGEYHAYIDGAMRLVSWPREYIVGEYLGSDAWLSTQINRFWFAEIDGVEHEMPYPGANAQEYYHLANIDGEGGMVQTIKSVQYLNKWYPSFDVGGIYYINVGGTIYDIGLAMYNSYTEVNGTAIWNPYQVGLATSVGTFDSNLQFHEYESVVFEDSYPNWIDGNPYLTASNGTTFSVNETYIFLIYEYFYNATTFYSGQQYPYSDMIGNETVFYYRTIDGSFIYLEYYQPLPLEDSFKVVAYYNSSYYNFDFMGESYVFNHDYQYTWGYFLFNSTSSYELFIDMWGSGFQPVYNFTYHGEEVTAVPHLENIHRLRNTWGYAMVYGPTPIQSVVYKNFHSLYVGTPEWGMWGIKAWTINPENGALDLDGNLETEEDQYYVRELYESTNTWAESYERLYVHISWDPNRTQYGDEMNIDSWMGQQTYSWSSQWSQTFFWYHASDFTRVGTAELETIKDTLFNEDDDPRPGYWDISWMAVNVSWADILAQAQAEGWDWIEEEQSWTWLTFAISQSYGTTFVNETGEHWVGLGMQYEYSGLMLWNDDNNNSVMEMSIEDFGGGELTHFFMPDSVDDIVFTTPGEAFDNYELQDSLTLDLEEEVSWGVAFTDVNGTLFPYCSYGYWGWYDGVATGTDFQDFDQRPTRATIDELSFDVTFQGHIDPTGESINNYADIKIDNYVGNWDLPNYDDEVARRKLTNRSLALNYYADVTIVDYTWSVYDESGSPTSNEPLTILDSDFFEFLLEDAPFAEVILGRDNYTWGSPNSAQPYYNVSSQITPYSTFTTAYQSERTQTEDQQYVSATTWAFASTQYYVTIGFPEWNGFSVFQDPVFVGYVSSRGTSGTQDTVLFSGLGISGDIPQADEPVQVSANIYAGTVTVNYVELWYRFDGGEWQQITMSNIGDWYYADIPGAADGVLVDYFIRVYTFDGNFDSQTKHYIVGQGELTSTTPQPPSGDDNVAILIMIGGGVAVIAIVAVAVVRRRK